MCAEVYDLAFQRIKRGESIVNAHRHAVSGRLNEALAG